MRPVTPLPRRAVNAQVSKVVSRLPQPAKLAIQSSFVYGAATLGLVILAQRVIANNTKSAKSQQPTPRVAATRVHAPTAFDEGLVAFNSFSL